VAYTKVQLRQGTTKVQAGAQQIAASVTAAAQAAAQSAAQQAAQQAQQAASGMNSRVRTGTLTARGWMAPRLESAADYTTSTVAPAVSDAVVKTLAPRVSGVLRSTARQVSPPDARSSKSSLKSALAWTSLVATVLAAAGAAGTLVWRRYRAAMAADTQPDAAADGTRNADSVTAGSTAASATKPGTADGSGTVQDDVPASAPSGESEASTASRPSSSAW
jgi:hypothetical protein